MWKALGPSELKENRKEREGKKRRGEERKEKTRPLGWENLRLVKLSGLGEVPGLKSNRDRISASVYWPPEAL